jgi:hypothetical protein
MIDQMVGIREIFEDPDYKAILDDMIDQRADGVTPSVKVAIARNIPLEELGQIEDDENYSDVQNAVNGRAEKEKARMDEEVKLDMNIAESVKAEEEYIAEMGYNDEQAAEYHQYFMNLMKIVGDGVVTKKEHAEIDNGRNYSKDTDDLRSQIPADPTKVVMPDKDSIAATQSEKVAKKKTAPRNSMESMGANTPTIGAFENVGKKRYNK